MPPLKIIIILGPTASGKTRMATRLARHLGGEIISADSRQIYRGMDLGTGKDLLDYIVDGASVPYHLIDIIDPMHEFSVYEFQQRFLACIQEIAYRKTLPIIVGGTGLYIHCILQRYKMLRVQENPILREELSVYDMPGLIERFLKVRPQAHNRTDLDDRKRLIRAIEIAESSALREKNEQIWPEYDCLVLGIRWERSVLRRRIQERLKYRLNAGLIDEVKRLHESGVTWERLETIGLEYRYVSKYLQGQMDILEMEKKLLTRIQQFAKRQDTWFRKMERAGFRIHWIAGNDYPALQSAVDQWLSNQ